MNLLISYLDLLNENFCIQNLNIWYEFLWIGNH